MLGLIAARVLKRRSLPLLSVEQKALIFDARSKGDIWPLVVLLLVIVLPRSLVFARVPHQYFSGTIATIFGAFFLLCVGVSATRLLRLWRMHLPSAYIRAAALGAVFVHAGLLLLILSFIHYAAIHPFP